MGRLILITHAHTRVEQQLDATCWRLSPTGEAQARQLAEAPFWGSVAYVLVSNEHKTRLSVEPAVQRWRLPVIADGRFDELHRGAWVNDYADRVRQVLEAPQASMGGWEPAATALERMLEGFTAHIDRSAGHDVALVGHGLTLTLLRAFLLGQDRAHFSDWQQLPFAAVAIYDLAANQMVQDFTAVLEASPRGL